MVRSVSRQAPVLLVCGEDDFVVKQRAKQVFEEWVAPKGVEQEILDAAVSNSGEALKILARFREALQTLPFFGSAKVVWLKDCNFLGDERAATAQAVNDELAGLAQELKDFSWEKVQVLISAGKVDKRKVFYKTLDKLGTVEILAGWSAAERDWADQAETWARKALRSRQKDISDEALGELVARVGPNARQLDSEVEKLALYAGPRSNIELEDVETVCVRNKTARAFALGDALGDRDLPRLLRCLDEELWEVKFDSQKTEIGLLYGLISKVRAMLLLKEMIGEGWIKADGDYNRFKAQLERVPAEQLPEDRRFNPKSVNPYVLYKALPQVNRYTQAELVRAMDLLLGCNQELVSSGAEEALVLQKTLLRIMGK
jgi:DNA polymerase III subunit delta